MSAIVTTSPFPGVHTLGRGFRLVDTRQKDFRFTCQRAILTYKTQLDKEKYRQFILSKPTCRDAKIWVAHEGSYSHVLISFDKHRFETRNETFFDYGVDSDSGEPLRPS